MLDPIPFKHYGTSKPGGDGYRTTNIISTGEKSLQNKLAEDEEFFRIMEMIKTEKYDQDKHPSQPEPEPNEESCNDLDDISYFTFMMLAGSLLASNIIQCFQNIIVRVKEVFELSFPYIWSWMKSVTRGTYTVSDGKIGLFILCVPLLTLVLLLYCSLLVLDGVTEVLLSNAPSGLTLMICNDKLAKLFSRQKMHP